MFDEGAVQRRQVAVRSVFRGFEAARRFQVEAQRVGQVFRELAGDAEARRGDGEALRRLCRRVTDFRAFSDAVDTNLYADFRRRFRFGLRLSLSGSGTGEGEGEQNSGSRRRDTQFHKTKTFSEYLQTDGLTWRRILRAVRASEPFLRELRYHKTGNPKQLTRRKP